MRIYSLILLCACSKLPNADYDASVGAQNDGSSSSPPRALEDNGDDDESQSEDDDAQGDGSGGGSTDGGGFGGGTDGGGTDGDGTGAEDDGDLGTGDEPRDPPYGGDMSTADDDGFDTSAITGTVDDDCDDALNDDLGDATYLSLEGQHTIFETIELCSGDYDMYAVNVPANTWLSLSVEIDGTGSGATDLDLYELEHPDHAIDDAIDFIGGETGALNILNYSGKSTDFERLAWYNPTDDVRTHHVVVLGFDGAAANYDLRVRTSVWHQDVDCEEVFTDTTEAGPCNRIMQFPSAVFGDQGYLVSHEQHYSNLRREMAYLIQDATAEVMDVFPGTNPLGLLDMGQADGDTPGRLDGSLRHPEGTHINGNDLDIAYYQTGSDNLGRAVCDNDGYNCTGPATILDAERTAYFMAILARSPHMRVIGVDTEVAYDVFAAAEALEADGLLSATDVARLEEHTAYSTEGWPFHHHHMHVSWNWEDGHSGLGIWTPPARCGMNYAGVETTHKPWPTFLP